MKKKGDAAPALLSIAVDVQGPELPARYVRSFGVDYPVVVDRANIVAGSLLGEKVIPLWTVLDEAGRLVASGRGGPGRSNVRRKIDEALARPTAVAARAATRPASMAELREAFKNAPRDVAARLTLGTRLAGRGDAENTLEALRVLDVKGFEGAAAKALHMARAAVLLGRDRREDALGELRAALALDGADYLVRKQIWSIEAPDRFYEGKVDYGWQRERMKRDRSAPDTSPRK